MSGSAGSAGKWVERRTSSIESTPHTPQALLMVDARAERGSGMSGDRVTVRVL